MIGYCLKLLIRLHFFAADSLILGCHEMHEFLMVRWDFIMCLDTTNPPPQPPSSAFGRDKKEVETGRGVACCWFCL
jgi:hypothetical protein